MSSPEDVILSKLLMRISINEEDRVEILTLQDNHIDLVSGDSTEMLQRARPLKGLEIRNSILAEHGFSALLTITASETSHRILFDFGFSEHGVVFNADALDVDLAGVETMVLSHGHIDHLGGLDQVIERVGRKGIELVGLSLNLFKALQGSPTMLVCCS